MWSGSDDAFGYNFVRKALRMLPEEAFEMFFVEDGVSDLVLDLFQRRNQRRSIPRAPRVVFNLDNFDLPNQRHFFRFGASDLR
jgi:hypothetical protein